MFRMPKIVPRYIKFKYRCEFCGGIFYDFQDYYKHRAKHPETIRVVNLA